jgi:hypothetical protein
MMNLIRNTMNEQQRYDTVFNVLTSAYVNGTLHVGNPCGCAVGNLVAAAIGVTFEQDGTWKGFTPKWSHKFTTVRLHTLFTSYKGMSKMTYNNGNHVQLLRMCLDDEIESEAMWQLEQIGLGFDILMGIEWHFETGSYEGKDNDERMFLGLMSVLSFLEDVWNIKTEYHQEKTVELSHIFEVNPAGKLV